MMELRSYSRLTRWNRSWPPAWGERQIAGFVQHDQIHSRQVLGEPPLVTGAGLGLDPVDEVDDK